MTIEIQVKNFFKPRVVILLEVCKAWFVNNSKFKIQNPKSVSACAALTLLILWLALMPAGSAPSGLGWDKLNHAGAIAVTTGLAFLSLRSRRRAATTAFLYGTFLGILIEILQGTMTTGRAAEWGDVAADLIGAGCAWVVIIICQRRTAPKP